MLRLLRRRMMLMLQIQLPVGADRPHAYSPIPHEPCQHSENGIDHCNRTDTLVLRPNPTCRNRSAGTCVCSSLPVRVWAHWYREFRHAGKGASCSGCWWVGWGGGGGGGGGVGGGW
jgi:hypothetical protein